MKFTCLNIIRICWSFSFVPPAVWLQSLSLCILHPYQAWHLHILLTHWSWLAFADDLERQSLKGWRRRTHLHSRLEVCTFTSRSVKQNKMDVSVSCMYAVVCVRFRPWGCGGVGKYCCRQWAPSDPRNADLYVSLKKRAHPFHCQPFYMCAKRF